MRWAEIVEDLNYYNKKSVKENSTAGATSSGNIATAVGGLGAGFDPDGDWGIYQKPNKNQQKKSKPTVIKRIN